MPDFRSSEVRTVIIDIPDDTPAGEIQRYLVLLRSQPDTVSAEAKELDGNLVIVRLVRV